MPECWLFVVIGIMPEGKSAKTSLRHEFEDPVSHMCLADAVVASWSLTQKVIGLNLSTVMTNIFVT